MWIYKSTQREQKENQAKKLENAIKKKIAEKLIQQEAEKFNKFSFFL